VADALSRRPRVHSLINIRFDFRDRIISHLGQDGWYHQVKAALEKGKSVLTQFEGYSLEKDGLLRFQGRMYVPANSDLRRLVMDEAHRAPYSAHPGVNQMHEALKIEYPVEK